MPDGGYPEETVNYLVDKNLRGMADKLKFFSASQPEGERTAPPAPQDNKTSSA
jgi:hypothetical protein